MIKRFIRRVLGLPSEAMQRVPRERHGLTRDAISPAAAKVCTVLRQAGFSAVGIRPLAGGLSQMIVATRTGAP